MKTSDCFSPGFVLRPHGIKGSILIGMKVEDPMAYAKLGALLIEQHQNLVPYMIEHISIKGNKAYVKLEGISTPEQAEALKNKTVYIPLDQMPEADIFSPERLVGLSVTDAVHGPLGVIKEITGSKVQRVLLIAHPSGREILVPYTSEFITEIDADTDTMHLATPDGLVELYLTDSTDEDRDDDDPENAHE